MHNKQTRAEKEYWLTLLTGKNKGEKSYTLPVLSGSMYPLLKPGDRLVIAPVNWKKCHIGDIIVFREEHHLVAHRLLFRYNIRERVILYQKGDSMPCGAFIRPGQIVGKALAVIAGGQTGCRYFNRPRQQRCQAHRELARAVYNRLKSLLRMRRWKKN
jgi:signal peptidase I